MENSINLATGCVSTRIIYIDSNGNDCKKEDAVEQILLGFDEKGECILSQYARLIDGKWIASL